MEVEEASTPDVTPVDDNVRQAGDAAPQLPNMSLVFSLQKTKGTTAVVDGADSPRKETELRRGDPQRES